MNPISFEKFTLANGLDVILHQDTSLPLVAVNVWYHVGSKDEKPGKTGYAHLFEHLMFEGSKHHNSGYFDSLQEVGATLNGSTTPDRTNYWENLPSHYLELALWLESDRMGFLLDALDQGRFDIQRDVVKNERRQSYENRPYGVSSIHLQEAVYPLPHPYHWPTIGFHEDLDAATLDDARAFFQRFYTPSNASLTIAGNIRIDEAGDMAERYFGDIPPGPALPRSTRTDSPLQGRVSLTLHDKVLLPRWSLVWPTTPRFHPDDAPLSVLASILGDGKSSRLHRALVYERRIAQSVSVHHGPSEIAGEFQLEVTAAAGHTADEVGEAALAEIQRMRDAPPLPEELARVKNRVEWQAGPPDSQHRRVWRKGQPSQLLQRLCRRPRTDQPGHGALSGRTAGRRAARGPRVSRRASSADDSASRALAKPCQRYPGPDRPAIPFCASVLCASGAAASASSQRG